MISRHQLRRLAGVLEDIPIPGHKRTLLSPPSTHFRKTSDSRNHDPVFSTRLVRIVSCIPATLSGNNHSSTILCIEAAIHQIFAHSREYLHGQLVLLLFPFPLCFVPLMPIRLLKPLNLLRQILVLTIGNSTMIEERGQLSNEFSGVLDG